MSMYLSASVFKINYDLFFPCCVTDFNDGISAACLHVSVAREAFTELDKVNNFSANYFYDDYDSTVGVGKLHFCS